MKIVVVGTPKTGNTWVKHLLANVYDLPLIRLGAEFSRAEVDSAGPRWIAHQHFLPTQDLIEWGTANQVVFVSAIRHPGDVLVSLWHHVLNHKTTVETKDSAHSASMRLDGGKFMGAATHRFAEQGFHLYLNLSVAWMRRSLARVVRYESLWDCPVETMQLLTDEILPTSEEHVRLAVCACELEIMQSLLDPDKKFLRQGGVSAWRSVLPPTIKTLFAQLDPYPRQFAALGYTMEESDPANLPRPAAVSVPSPFGTDKTFANGTPCAPVIMKAYCELPKELRAGWADPRITTDDSFHAWLNRPATVDPHSGRVAPILTELAHYIYSLRPDVRTAFPDIFGRDRVLFAEWFLGNARKEYGIDRSFTQANRFSSETRFANGTPFVPVLVKAYYELPEALRARWSDPGATADDSFFAWLNRPTTLDPYAGDVAPVITEFAHYLYSSRPDVRAAFPQIFGTDRAAYTDWFSFDAQAEYGFDPLFARANPFSSGQGFANGVRASRVLVRAWYDLPERLRMRWPEPTRVGPGSFFEWLNSAAAAEPAGTRKLAPVVTELGAYLHAIRPDVASAMPDLYGQHRVNFTNWFLSSARQEYELDRAFTLPVIRSWADCAEEVPTHILSLRKSA